MPVISSPYALFQHATTAKAIIKAALRKIGALAAGETPEAGELEDAREEFNRMLDSANTERLVVNVLNRTEWTLSPGTDSVEIGPGASLDTTRPNRIEQGEAYIRDAGQEFPLRVWSQERWASITDKAQTGRPWILTYEPSFPLGVIRLFPKTDKAYDLVLYTWNLLGQISSVESALVLPPAYADWLTNELAVRLAPEYGKATPAEVAIAAAQGRAALKRINQPSSETRVDDALVGRGGRYNILSDTWPYGGA